MHYVLLCSAQILQHKVLQLLHLPAAMVDTVLAEWHKKNAQKLTRIFVKMGDTQNGPLVPTPPLHRARAALPGRSAIPSAKKYHVEIAIPRVVFSQILFDRMSAILNLRALPCMEGLREGCGLECSSYNYIASVLRCNASRLEPLVRRFCPWQLDHASACRWHCSMQNLECTQPFPRADAVIPTLAKCASMANSE